MDGPIEPQHLLDQAWDIALIEEPGADRRGTDEAEMRDSILRGVRRPLRPEDYRRAISAAYYGLFHAITIASASLFAPSSESRNELVRRYRHGDLKAVTGWVRNSGTPPKYLTNSVETMRQDRRVQMVCDAFQRLNKSRESADYDHNASFTQQHVLDHVRLAQQAVNLIPDRWIFDEILPGSSGGLPPEIPGVAEIPHERYRFVTSPGGRLFLGLLAGGGRA